ncbi:CaiB/BaiF CoA transferase family protein [Pseudoduganella sp. GCM10020061]|uniref:CaiB/BaiF CoA transferase family protein n=1 Tax=Pseudoduganella sp. GCM10020061 TaxID=3317345 RepID=UPI00364476F8
MAGPLAGIRVVEMVGIGPCPFAAMMLADMGAHVIRIDRQATPGAPNPFPILGTKFDVMARSRDTLALDLKQEGARELVLELVAGADILVEGFRPGVMERLGLGPDVCLGRNPRLVYGRVTGWGQEGPLSQAAGHDINYIALSGMLAAMGRPGTPPDPPLNLLGDFGGGGMMLAFGVVCAALEAKASGKGQVVDAAMVDGAATLGAMVYGMRAAGAWSRERGANMLDGGAHFYGTYACADGKFVAIGAIEPQFYRRLLEAAGIDDPAFARQNDPVMWPALRDKLAALMRQRTRDEWCALLEGSDACFAPVLDIDEAPQHAHNHARGTYVDIDGVVQPAPAPRFSRTAADMPRAAGNPASPADVLRAWGLSGERIDAFAGRGVIAPRR